MERRRTMKAIVCPRYGPPDVLRLDDVEVPIPGADEVLIRVRAAAVSISDCIIRSGRVKPAMWLPFRLFVGLRRPRRAVLGLDLSGEVEAVGSNVTRFKPGDEVFAYTGRRFGAYAEYVCLRDVSGPIPASCTIERKPENVTYQEAATAPSRGMLALYFLGEAAIRAGQQVLIYGASGGIGVFAVQLAAHYGANVTAVCGAGNLEFVKSLGADRVLDYTRDDTAAGGPYDVFFDAAGGRKSSALKVRCRTALVPGGTSISVDRRVNIPASYMHELRTLIESGAIKPFVDKAYPLAQTAQAHRYVESGHKRGGVAVVP